MGRKKKKAVDIAIRQRKRIVRQRENKGTGEIDSKQTKGEIDRENSKKKVSYQ